MFEMANIDDVEGGSVPLASGEKDVFDSLGPIHYLGGSYDSVLAKGGLEDSPEGEAAATSSKKRKGKSIVGETPVRKRTRSSAVRASPVASGDSDIKCLGKNSDECESKGESPSDELTLSEEGYLVQDAGALEVSNVKAKGKVGSTAVRLKGKEKEKYVPNWSVSRGDMFSDPLVCAEAVAHFAPPAERERVHQLGAEGVSSGLVQKYAEMGTFLSEAMGYLFGQCDETARVKKDLVSYEKRVAVDSSKIKSLQAKNKVLVEEHDRDLKVIAGLEEEKAEMVKSFEEERRLLDVEKKKLDEERREFDLNRGKAEAHVRMLEEEKQILSARLNRALADRRWLIGEGIDLFVNRLGKSAEFLSPLLSLQMSARRVGFHEGLKMGYDAVTQKIPLESVKGYDVSAREKFAAQANAFESLVFPYLVSLRGCVESPLSTLQSLLPVAKVRGVFPRVSAAARSGQTSSQGSFASGMDTPQSIAKPKGSIMPVEKETSAGKVVGEEASGTGVIGVEMNPVAEIAGAVVEMSEKDQGVTSGAGDVEG